MRSSVKTTMARVIDVVGILTLIAAAAYIVHLQRRIDALERRIDVLSPPAEAEVGDDVSGLIRGGPSARLLVYLTPRCGSCTTNMPAWAEISRRVGAANVIVLVPRLMEAPPAEIRQYLREHDLRYGDVVYVSSNDVDRYRFQSVPRTYIVDERGVIARLWRGRVDPASVVTAWSQVTSRSDRSGGKT